MDRAARRQVLRDRAPLTARAQHVHQPVHHRPQVHAALAAAAFVGFGALEVWVGREAIPVDRRLVYGAIAAVLIVALARAEDAGALVVRPRWPALLGDSSYALYLLHIPIISVLCKVLVQLHVSNRFVLVGAFVAIALFCVLASVVFYLLIERRMLARLRFTSGRASREYSALPDSKAA